MIPKVLYTIGYEGATPADFWATLSASGIRTLIDVRDVPVSRRPGFSKKALGLAADGAGLSYIHLPGLGDPKEGREAARTGQHVLFLKIFSAHMRTAEALADLDKAITLSSNAQSCLLCYERSPEQCHRSIVASHMAKIGNFRVNHLGVRIGFAQNSQRMREQYDAGDHVLGGI